MTIPNWCSKFVSALAVLSVSMFGTSCNDEEFANSTRKPLQLSVTTNAPLVSRAIINDTYLPDGSQIGVTLTATDGSAYDNQDFYNLEYTASGTGAEQVWSSAIPASLSTTSGKVIAYYPYNGTEELDLTAIPVETALQTDYMYAKPVIGIDFTSADINLNMQHAMTDIRINLKKGTYTGTGEVTKVTAKAPAFATSATMDVETGVFANVSGSGAQFVQEFTDLTLTTTVYSQDFLMVPDAKSTSGEVSILTIIDGKKFAVTVPYTESFQQGYSYVYNLTLDNSGLVLEGVDVSKWSVKVKEEQGLEFYDNQYIVEIQVPNDGYKYKHNINGYDVVIDWGDGTTSYEKTFSSIDYPQHIFEKAGTYIVTCQGNVSSISTDYYSTTRIISKIIHIGKELGLRGMRDAFRGHSLLKEIPTSIKESLSNVTTFQTAFMASGINNIPKGIFDYCTKAQNFSGTFASTSITQIPKGLFDKCTEATGFGSNNASDMYGVFYDCKSLTTIPKGLFNKCTKVTDFMGVFESCSSLAEIPEDLFDNCSEVTRFRKAFYNCKSLQAIPEGLFDDCVKVTSFSSAFYNCTSLTSIPEGLFDNNTEVTSFQDAFQYCSGLTSLPAGMFDKCTKVTSFGGAFDGCSKLQTIPVGLFDKCTEVTAFQDAFKNCKNLQTIPDGLFDKCTEVTTFEGAFWYCTGLTEIPEGLFDNNTKVKNFYQTFYNCSELITINGCIFNCPESTTFQSTFGYCSKLQAIPEGLFDKCTKVKNFNGTFLYCSSLQTIPEGLFDKCTEVTNFQSTFSSCSSLTTIPAGLFDKCPVVTSFNSTFSSCKNLQAIPEGLFDKCTEATGFGATFNYCTSLQSIPEGLFDHCTKVTDFSYLFRNCKSLTSVPVGLFNNCTMVTNFYETFNNCTIFEGESPYMVIKVDGVDTKVHLYERSNYPEYFTTPTNFSYCFKNCSSLTDYSSIPSSWL